MSVSSGAPDGVRARIAGEMIERGGSHRPPVDDIDRVAEPPTRPTRRAQWDEVAGRWVEWDDIDHEWDPVEAAVDAAADSRAPSDPSGPPTAP